MAASGRNANLMTRNIGAVATAMATALLALALARAAHAGPVLLTTRPMPDGDTDDFVFFAGGISDSGRSLKGAKFELVIDGQRAGAPASAQALSEWAAATGESNPARRPPLRASAWSICGLRRPGRGSWMASRLFSSACPRARRCSPRFYGRMRQGRARLSAADVGRLGDVAYLEGYRPNLVEAVRLDLPDLAADPAPLKLLLLVTDGRDFADPKGQGPGDFSALGKELRRRASPPSSLRFRRRRLTPHRPPPPAHDLQAASGGFLRSVENVQEIENALESLGQAIADLNLFRVVPPWTWNIFGGAHRLSVKLTAAGGQRLTADVGTVTVGPGNLRWLVIGGLLAAAAIAGFFALRGRRPAPRREENDDVIVKAAHDLVARRFPKTRRRGADPHLPRQDQRPDQPGSRGPVRPAVPHLPQPPGQAAAAGDPGHPGEAIRGSPGAG